MTLKPIRKLHSLYNKKTYFSFDVDPPEMLKSGLWPVVACRVHQPYLLVFGLVIQQIQPRKSVSYPDKTE